MWMEIKSVAPWAFKLGICRHDNCRSVGAFIRYYVLAEVSRRDSVIGRLTDQNFLIYNSTFEIGQFLHIQKKDGLVTCNWSWVQQSFQRTWKTNQRYMKVTKYVQVLEIFPFKTWTVCRAPVDGENSYSHHSNLWTCCWSMSGRNLYLTHLSNMNLRI